MRTIFCTPRFSWWRMSVSLMEHFSSFFRLGHFKFAFNWVIIVERKFLNIEGKDVHHYPQILLQWLSSKDCLSLNSFGICVCFSHFGLRSVICKSLISSTSLWIEIYDYHACIFIIFFFLTLLFSILSMGKSHTWSSFLAMSVLEYQRKGHVKLWQK